MKIYYCDDQMGHVVDFESTKVCNTEDPFFLKTTKLANDYCRYVGAPPYEFIADEPTKLKDGTRIVEVETSVNGCELVGYFAYGPSAEKLLKERCRWWAEQPWESEIVKEENANSKR